MKTIRGENDSVLLDFSDHISTREQVLRQVIDAIDSDREGKVKAALIELGWTPPGRGAEAIRNAALEEAAKVADAEMAWHDSICSRDPDVMGQCAASAHTAETISTKIRKLKGEER